MNKVLFIPFMCSTLLLGAQAEFSVIDPLYILKNETAVVKTVYLIRHGQAFHNIGECQHYPDAELTDHGRDQAMKISCSICIDPQPDLILFSPLRRAVETLDKSFGHLCKSGEVTCLAIADLQEDWNGEHGYDCDTGSAPSQLSKRFPLYDFSTLTDDWMRADSHLPRQQKTNERHDRIRAWLSVQSASRIIIVAHHGTIKGLLADSDAGIGNGDTLKYTFDVERQIFVKDYNFVLYKNSMECQCIQ